MTYSQITLVLDVFDHVWTYFFGRVLFLSFINYTNIISDFVGQIYSQNGTQKYRSCLPELQVGLSDRARGLSYFADLSTDPKKGTVLKKGTDFILTIDLPFVLMYYIEVS